MNVYPEYSQKKIQSALRTKKEIRFTRGVYLISTPLLIYSNSHIIIDKGAVLRQAGAIDHVLLTHSTKNTTLYNGVHDVTIDGGGTIEGMSKYNYSLNLLTLCHSKNVVIRDITFKDAQGYHALEINSSSNISVINCTFSGHRSFLKEKEFREAIQIDSAVESALAVMPRKSKWYDGTTCFSILIQGCTFEKSKDRRAYSRCIGNHAQIEANHERIYIYKNKFIGGTQENINSAAVSLIGMNNVSVIGNLCTGYGRFTKIYRQNYTYSINGVQHPANDNDGLCNNVRLSNNIVGNPIGTVKNHNIYVQGNHKNIEKL